MDSPRTPVGSPSSPLAGGSATSAPGINTGADEIVSVVLKATDLQRPFDPAALSAKLGGRVPLTPRKLDFARQLWVEYQVVFALNIAAAPPKNWAPGAE